MCNTVTKAYTRCQGNHHWYINIKCPAMAAQPGNVWCAQAQQVDPRWPAPNAVLNINARLPCPTCNNLVITLVSTFLNNFINAS